MSLVIRPITLRAANAFVEQHHRHNKPSRGHKFSVAVFNISSETGQNDRFLPGTLVGVAIVGRPSARHLDDGVTIEVTRTCTDGFRNANSMLYGAAWRASKAMGYERSVTYTQGDEDGASLRAVGYVKSAALKARKGWADSTADPELKAMRDSVGNGGVPRVRWEIRT